MSDKNYIEDVQHLLDRETHIDESAYYDLKRILEQMNRRRNRQTNFPIGTRVRAIQELSCGNGMVPEKTMGVIRGNASALYVVFDNGINMKWPNSHHIEKVEDDSEE